MAVITGGNIYKHKGFAVRAGNDSWFSASEPTDCLLEDRRFAVVPLLKLDVFPALHDRL